MRRIIFLLSAITCVSACATQKTLHATGGSKSDGIVEFSYEHTIFESPVIDQEDTKTKALQRCNSWGYANAEPFDNGFSKCVYHNANGTCLKKQVKVSYQCSE